MRCGLHNESDRCRIYTPERLEIEFSPAKWHADREATLDRHHRESVDAITRWCARTDVRYGAGPLQTVDVFPALDPQAPCCVILHGGFWRISDKAAFSFIGGFLRSRGIAAIVANFDLCPAVTIDEIVNEVRNLLDWVSNNVARLGIDTERLLLFGHATGAHLAAMAIAHKADRSWQSKIVGSFLISGLYDLRQVPALSVNTILGLTNFSARRNSPLLGIEFHVKAPVVLAAAEYETSEFRAQSDDMGNRLRHWGVDVHQFTIANCGHFTVLDSILGSDCEAMNKFIQIAFGATNAVEQITEK
jgi:arylformamidase